MKTNPKTPKEIFDAIDDALDRAAKLEMLNDIKGAKRYSAQARKLSEQLAEALTPELL